VWRAPLFLALVSLFHQGATYVARSLTFHQSPRNKHAKKAVARPTPSTGLYCCSGLSHVLPEKKQKPRQKPTQKTTKERENTEKTQNESQNT
jgi:hypothetical protein